MGELEKEAVKVLTALLFSYGTHMDADATDQESLMKSHATFSNARRLIDALKKGRVKLVKTELWKD